MSIASESYCRRSLLDSLQCILDLMQPALRRKDRVTIQDKENVLALLLHFLLKLPLLSVSCTYSES